MGRVVKKSIRGRANSTRASRTSSRQRTRASPKPSRSVKTARRLVASHVARKSKQRAQKTKQRQQRKRVSPRAARARTRTPTQRRAQSLVTASPVETDLLYWISAFRSAQRRERSQARAHTPRDEIVAHATHGKDAQAEANATATTAKVSHQAAAEEGISTDPAESSASATSETLPSRKTVQEETTPVIQPATSSHSESPGTPAGSPQQQQRSHRSHTLLHDALPLFTSLLNGSLGPAALEVILLGHISLLADPLLFTQTLEDHKNADSAALRRLQDSVTVFLLLGKVNLYCLDPTSYPVLPLLARLLMSSSVTLVTLHVRLIFDLLLLFLGSDRIQLGERVVDVEVWSEVIQRSGVTHSNHCCTYNIRGQENDTDGHGSNDHGKVNSCVIIPHTITELTEALSIEQQQGVAAYGDTMTRWVAQLKQQEEESAQAVRMQTQRRSLHFRSSSSPSVTAADNNDGDDDKKHNSKRGRSKDGENKENQHEKAQDALVNVEELLHTQTANSAQGAPHSSATPSFGTLPHCTTSQRSTSPSARLRRCRSYSLPLAPHGLSEPVWAVVQHFSAESLGRTLATLASVYSFHDTVLAPVLTHGSALWLLCVRYTYMCVLCTIMTHHGLFVSKTRYDVMQADLQGQIDDIAAAAEALMCTESQHGIAKHSTHNSYNTASTNRGNSTNKNLSDDAKQCDSHAPLVLHSLSAQDVLEHLLCSVDGNTRDTLLSTSEPGNLGEALPRRPAQAHGVNFLRYCVSVLSQHGVGRAPCAHNEETNLTHPTAHSVTDHECDEENRRRSKGRSTTATNMAQSAQRALSLAIMWLAVRERREYQKSLYDFLTTGGGKLVAHVLSAASSAHVCFSLHSYWDIHVGTTGRIFSSGPNVQNMARKPMLGLYAVLPHATMYNRQEDSSDTVDCGSHTRNIDDRAQSRRSTTEHDDKYEGHMRHTAGVCTRTAELCNDYSTAVCYTRPTVPLLRRCPSWTLRHLCVAPPGCLLVSFDYNQIELRVLAHMSGDEKLIAHLSQPHDGSEGRISSNSTDVLRQMAAAVVRVSDVSAVTDEQRQAVKLLVYGLIYGMGVDRMQERIDAFFGSPPRTHSVSNADACAHDASHTHTHAHPNDCGMHDTRRDQSRVVCEQDVTLARQTDASEHSTRDANGGSRRPGTDQQQQLASNSSSSHTQTNAEAAHTPLSAAELLRAFRLTYPRVHSYLQATRQHAVQRRWVRTLSGVKDLSSQADPSRRRQHSVAHAIQGSAADILHSAMRELHLTQHTFLSYFPVAASALVMVVHDELVYAISSAAVELVVPKMVHVMQKQSELFGLSVPLHVTVRTGCSLGELQQVSAAHNVCDVQK